MSRISDHEKYEYIFFDFDGVWTDNYVFTDSKGNELVRTSKSDSLGLYLFRQTLEKQDIALNLLIISKERNLTPKRRAEKLNIECVTGVDDKLKFAKSYLRRDSKEILSNVIYLGNDLNDLEIMKEAGYSMCPSDSHEEIQKISDFVGTRLGGQGFVREALMYISDMITLYPDKFRRNQCS